MADFLEARKRSVDNLQRLYTFVVSLAVTESLRKLLADFGTNGQYPHYNEWLIFFSLIATVIPFYHGANRYLDAAYVTNERAVKPSALMVDFIALFLEGLILFGLAVVSNNTRFFYTGLAILLLFDMLWVWFTLLHATEDKKSGHTAWITINIVATGLLFIFAQLKWHEGAQNIALAGVAIGRTVADYFWTWNFYYPKDIEIGIDTPTVPQSQTD
jgi:hypothetical protein